jgi:hypothetical protein
MCLFRVIQFEFFCAVSLETKTLHVCNVVSHIALETLRFCLAGHGVLQQLRVLLAKALEDGTLDCSDAMVSAVALASLRSLPGKLLEDLAELAAQGIDSCTTDQIVSFLRLLASSNTLSGVAFDIVSSSLLMNLATS